MKLLGYILSLLAIICLSDDSFAQIRLPRLISDGMVLQRDKELTIWGWASPDERISVEFAGYGFQTVTDITGRWEFKMPPMPHGGPYEMRLKGQNELAIKDILIGDVWLCSGQSNMELPMRRVSWVYPDVIASSENSMIRHFYVPRQYAFDGPQDDFNGGNWVTADPVSVLDFSATAYFFALNLFERFGVPIGLINSAYGGSPVEAWISEEGIRQFPKYASDYRKHQEPGYIQSVQEADQDRINAWYKRLTTADRGYNDPSGKWNKPGFDDSGWETMSVPGYWAEGKTGFVNGVFWFRKEVQLSSQATNSPSTIILGCIVDSDSVFINGQFVGTTGYQYPPRRYTVPAGVLKEGTNQITVRVVNESGRGGFVKDKSYELIVGDEVIDLTGDWKFRMGAKMEPLPGRTFFNNVPVGLYNAMINPLLKYTFKGAIWYQGESNAGRPADYEELFISLIRDWRAHKRQGDFPFLFVQLPNFMQPKAEPSESNWALIREAQANALKLPGTGMAVAIDIGEWNDIHPLNKKDVGHRLAMAARKVAYGEKNIIFSGPVYKSMKRKGNHIEVTFSHVGKGLRMKGEGKPKQFAIAGSDGKFVWADARVRKKKVLVSSPAVSVPVSVRYAWSDNPEGANLVNSAGLPAAPFRTDIPR